MMTTPTYVISYGVDFADPRVHVFSKRSDAVQFVDGVFSGGAPNPVLKNRTAFVASSEADIPLNSAALAAIFNGLTDSGVKKFESHAVGRRRLFNVLPTVAKPAPAAQQEEKKVSENASENGATRRRGRAPTGKFADGTLRILEVAANPKRPGSKTHEMFEKVRVGMTVAQLREIGYGTKDLEFETEKGYFKIGS